MLLLLSLSLAADPAPSPGEPSAHSTLSPDLVAGQLDNGLRWYILPVEAEDERIAVRLRVDVGAVDEAPQEEGAAHFLEHMSFESSRRYSSDERSETMRALSIPMGEHWGASTSFEHTVWYTSVSASAPDGLRTILDVMADQVLRPKLVERECDHQRDVVLEELRMRQGTLASRLSQAARSVAFAGTSPAERDVGGRTDRVASLDCATARHFWATHYGPERAMMVVTGTTDVAATAAWIEQAFGGWKARDLVPLQVITRASSAELAVQVQQEPRASHPTVAVVLPGPDGDSASPASLEETLAWDVGLNVLFDRLRRLWYAGEPLLSTPKIDRNKLSPTREMTEIRVTPPAGQEAAAAVTLWREIERLATSGISPAELTSTRATMLQDVQVKTTHPSARELASSLMDQLEGDPRALDVGLRAARYEAALAQLTTGRVQEAFRRLAHDGQGRGVVLVLPPRRRHARPGRAALGAGSRGRGAVASAPRRGAAAAVRRTPSPGRRARAPR